MKAIVKNTYTDEQYEVKVFESYKEAEEYVFIKYNAVYEIKKESNEATFYVYSRAQEGIDGYQR